MIVALPLLVFGVAIMILLAAVTPSVDLVRREVRVRPWFAAPLLATLLWALPGLALAVLGSGGWNDIETAAMVVAWFQFSVAAGMLFLGGSLALSRGLQPGGMTTRRRRTSVVAIAVLLSATLGASVWVVVGPSGSELWAWVVPAVSTGIVWVLALNRHGSERLERGKAMSASFLIGAALCFWSGMALVYWTSLLNAFSRIEGYAGLWIGGAWVVGVMVGGLRLLAGRLAPAPLFGALGVSLVSVVPLSLFWMWTPVDRSLPLARWVDLRGERTSLPVVLMHSRCVEVVGREACGIRHDAVAAPPGLPLTELPLLAGSELLVEDGRFTGGGRWDWSGDRILQWDHGQPVLDGERLSWPVGLHEALVRHQRGVLKVERSPDRTVQDFISICASHRSECRLRDL